MDRDPIITAFNDAATGYRRAGAPFLDACTELVLDRLGLRPGDALFDVACGPGTIALPAARRLGAGGSVIAIDLAERQLAIARAAAPSGPALRFRHEDACAPALGDRSVDAVACGLGLPYFQEPLRAIREAARIARPGARLVWSVWGVPFFGRPGQRFLHVLARRDIAPALRRLTHTPEELAELAFRAGLQAVVIEEHDLDIRFASFDAWWEMARAFAFLTTLDAAEPETRDAIREQLAQDPAVVEADGAVCCRLRILLLRGTA